jgi:predicted aspartyl protease
MTSFKFRGLSAIALLACLAGGLASCSLPSIGEKANETPAKKPAKVAEKSVKVAEKSAGKDSGKTAGKTHDKPTSKPTANAKAKAVPKGDNGATYREALDRADSARSISQSAQTPEDWDLTMSRWEQAIETLENVPEGDVNRKYVPQRLAEFNRGLAIAQAKAKGFDLPLEVEPVIYADRAIDRGQKLQSASTQRSYRVPIKYRRSKIPVIDVTFNGKYVFEMMVDTGASGTMITPEIAKATKMKVLGSTTILTAAGKAEAEVGMINSITVGGDSIYDVPVTVGPTGLLGHDFFKDCELTIRRDVVEFEQCST